MKKLFCIALLFVAISIQAQESWTVVRSKDGKASVEMPKAPEMISEKMDSEVGEVIMNMQILDMSANDGDNMTMGLMSLEYPITMRDSINTPEKLKIFYDNAMNGAAANMGGIIQNQEEVEVGGHPGRQFKVDIMSGMAIVTMMYFQVDDIGYMAQIISKGDAADNKEAKRFLSSFKLEED